MVQCSSSEREKKHQKESLKHQKKSGGRQKGGIVLGKECVCSSEDR